MKKILIFAVLGFLFFKGVTFVDNKINEEFFDEFYTRDYGSDPNAAEEPGVIDKVVHFFKGLVSSDEEAEKYIYK